MPRRSRVSASGRVRATFACFAPCDPSLYRRRMCRNLTLLVPATVLAFFAGGGATGPTWAIDRCRSASDVRSGRKHSSTTYYTILGALTTV